MTEHDAQATTTRHGLLECRSKTHISSPSADVCKADVNNEAVRCHLRRNGPTTRSTSMCGVGRLALCAPWLQPMASLFIGFLCIHSRPWVLCLLLLHYACCKVIESTLNNFPGESAVLECDWWDSMLLLLSCCRCPSNPAQIVSLGWEPRFLSRRQGAPNFPPLPVARAW